MTGLVLTVPEADGGDGAVRLVWVCAGSPGAPGAQSTHVATRLMSGRWHPQHLTSFGGI